MNDLGLLLGGFIKQALNEGYLYNLNDCVYYGYQIVDHSQKTLGYISDLKIDKSIVEASFAVHKAPHTLR